MQLLPLGVNEIRFTENFFSTAEVTSYAANPDMEQQIIFTDCCDHNTVEQLIGAEVIVGIMLLCQMVSNISLYFKQQKEGKKSTTVGQLH